MPFRPLFKLVELVGGGSVINGAYQVYLLTELMNNSITMVFVEQPVALPGLLKNKLEEKAIIMRSCDFTIIVK